MKKYFTKSLFILSVILTSCCAPKINSGEYRGYETPEYKVLNKSENIEVRNYDKYLVAEVEVEGSRKESVKKGFWILAKYIFGGNIAKENIAMTSPVNQSNFEKSEAKNYEKIAMTSPVSQIPNQSLDQNLEKSQKWLVQFKMPKKYSLESLPQPLNKSIKFKEIKPKKALAITFSGFWSDEKFLENNEKISQFAAKNSLKLIGQPIISYYDDPLTLPWNRRNEIIWQIIP
ncbi:MAG: heme-binding protein [Pelagibacterales bacterium]|nr:heme-binding protein [Pelagibacterales bacterium]